MPSPKTNEPTSGEAERLLNHPLLNTIFDALEHDALEIAIHANPSDDETRRTSMNEVRAIRNLRQKLKTLASGNEFEGATTLPQKA